MVGLAGPESRFSQNNASHLRDRVHVFFDDMAEGLTIIM